jgi:hypothetical protein
MISAEEEDMGMIFIILVSAAFAILVGSLAGLGFVALVYRRWLTFRLKAVGFVLGGASSGAVALSTPLLVDEKAGKALLVLVLLGCAGGLLSGLSVPILGRSENKRARPT